MLTGRALDDFDTAAFDFICRHEGYERQPYLDIRAIPTIGVGYALLVKEQERFILRPTLARDFAGIHVFSRDETELLDIVAHHLTTGNVETARASYESRAPGTLDFTLSEDPHGDGRRLYDLVAPDLVKAAIPMDIRDALSGTCELSALSSLAYNAPSLIGNNLKTAIRSGNRPAAWFEILYRSNRARDGVRPLGLHNRRVAEAELFGLYAGGDRHENAEEAEAVTAFLNDHRDEMLTYLSGVKQTDRTGAATADAYSAEECEAILSAHIAPAEGRLT